MGTRTQTQEYLEYKLNFKSIILKNVMKYYYFCCYYLLLLPFAIKIILAQALSTPTTEAGWLLQI